MRYTLTLIFGLILSVTHAQTKFVNEFLNIGVGARAQGMFGSVVASTKDASSAYWNPSRLTDIKAPMSISAMHANWFGNIANYDQFSIAKSINNGKSYAAISFIRLGIDDIPNTLNIVNSDGTIDFSKVSTFSAADNAFLLSYATKVGGSEKLSIGGNVKIIRRLIGTFSSAWGFGADISASYNLGRLTIGANARDITTTFNTWSFKFSEEEKNILLSTGNSVPISSSELTLPRLILGAAYDIPITSKLNVLAELDLNLSSNSNKAGILASKSFIVDPSFGAEIDYAKRVFLRFGLGNMQRRINAVNTNTKVFDIQPNIGLGVKLGRLSIDYALANVGNVSGVLASHIISLNLDFKPKTSEPNPN